MLDSYARGSDKDYDDWASFVDDDSWSAANMKKYMRKHQTLEPVDENLNDVAAAFPFVGENHGTEGPIHTSFNDSRAPFEDSLIKAAHEAAGLEQGPPDPWSGDHIGFYSAQNTISRSGPHKGKRSYSALAYFNPNKDRSNLRVLCDSVVTNIIIQGRKAVGVNFSTAGRSYSVSARHEVILSAGSIKTPQLLELSGIGNPSVLQTAGVECKVELPGVGQNLQDHVATGTTFELPDGVPSGDSLHKPEVMASVMKTFEEQKAGPLTNSSPIAGFFPYRSVVSDEELEAVVKSIRDTQSQLPKESLEFKQYEQIIANLQSEKSATLRIQVLPATANASKEALTNNALIFPPPSDPNANDGLTIALSLEYPVSRGWVHITSTDPNDEPAINPNYLKHPADVAVLAAGLRLIDRWTRLLSSPSNDGAPAMGKRLYPPASEDMSDLAVAESCVRDFAVTQWHWMSTCAMGEVVDSRLKVKGGITRLRIVDASVFPACVSGNIGGTVYALAEKAADLILEDWRGERGHMRSK